jgi:hypothetical protein
MRSTSSKPKRTLQSVIPWKGRGRGRGRGRGTDRGRGGLASSQGKVDGSLALVDGERRAGPSQGRADGSLANDGLASSRGKIDGSLANDGLASSQGKGRWIVGERRAGSSRGKIDGSLAVDVGERRADGTRERQMNRWRWRPHSFGVESARILSVISAPTTHRAFPAMLLARRSPSSSANDPSILPRDVASPSFAIVQHQRSIGISPAM